MGGDLVEMKRAVDDDDIASLVKIAELVNDISFAMKKLSKVVIMVTDGAVAGAAVIWRWQLILLLPPARQNSSKPL